MPLNFRIALVKLLGGTIALGSGFFLGREGPTVQLGASVAAPLTNWLPTTSQHKRQLIAAGAGAGLTAAFNAPLAGVVFVLEELLKEMKASTIMIAVVACSVACLVLNVISPPHLRAAVHTLAPIISFSPIDLPFYLLLGVIAGLLGAVFNGGILGALNLNRRLRCVPVTLKVGFAGLISGAIISVMPEAFHNYAGMRALIIAGQTDYQTVILAFLEFYLLTLIGYGSGAPGGLFAPSLALGSAVGYLVGFLEQTVMGTGSTAAFALVGMGAFFAGVARTPLTALVITFELTTNFDLLMPLMLACVISTAVGELVSKGGLYDHLMRWNGINLQGPGSSNNLRTMKASDVMHKRSQAFSSKLLIKDVLPSFGTSSQRGFPVVDKGILVGVVTQTDLAKLGQFEELAKISVADIMTAHPVAVSPYDSLEDILFLFSQHKFTWLPVIYHEKFRGIISQSDVLEALFTPEKEPVSSGQESVMPAEILVAATTSKQNSADAAPK
jgi:chloride channel protein, CIC family